MKLFNGANNAALSYHLSPHYCPNSTPPPIPSFQNILDPPLRSVSQTNTDCNRKHEFPN